jgi:exonuclease VII small subunit
VLDLLEEFRALVQALETGGVDLDDIRTLEEDHETD